MIQEDIDRMLKESGQLRDNDITKQKDSEFKPGKQNMFINELSWTTTKKEPVSPMCILTFHGSDNDNKERSLDYFLVFSTGPENDKGARFQREKAFGFLKTLGMSKEDDYAAKLKELADNKQCMQVVVKRDEKPDGQGGTNVFYTVTPIRILGSDESSVADVEPPF